MADSSIHNLFANRPRNHFLRASCLFGLALVIGAFAIGDLGWEQFLSANRWDNAWRFMGELIPYYLRDGDPNTTYTTWFDSVIVSRGIPAALTTLLISIVAVGIAGFASLLFAPIAARNINRGSPFGVASSRAGSEPGSWFVRILGRTVRFLFILARAIPEYIYAFLLLAIYGPHTWPLILALAIHNFGILGRLTSEALEDFPTQRPANLRAAGLSRTQVVFSVLLPGVLPRFFVYFFYRWETCIRDATVLGMLGVASLGFLIRDARARFNYDELLAYVLIGVLLVLGGDFASWLVRRFLRH